MSGTDIVFVAAVKEVLYNYLEAFKGAPVLNGGHCSIDVVVLYLFFSAVERRFGS